MHIDFILLVKTDICDTMNMSCSYTFIYIYIVFINEALQYTYWYFNDCIYEIVQSTWNCPCSIYRKLKGGHNWSHEESLLVE